MDQLASESPVPAGWCAVSNYTPTTEEVRDDWDALMLEGGGSEGSRADANFDRDRRNAQFDRWLAEVERAAAEKALTKAADDLRVNFSSGAAIAMHHECHKKQCRCGNPGSDEIVREVFEAAREAIRNEALAYRLNEGEKQ